MHNAVTCINIGLIRLTIQVTGFQVSIDAKRIVVLPALGTVTTLAVAVL
jgi:hypothetical protein